MELMRGNATVLSRNRKESAQWSPCSVDARDRRLSRGLAMAMNALGNSENSSLSVITVATTEGPILDNQGRALDRYSGVKSERRRRKCS